MSSPVSSPVSSPTNQTIKRLSSSPRPSMGAKRTSSGRLLGMLRRRSLSRTSSASTDDSSNFALSTSTIDFIQDNIRRNSKEDIADYDETEDGDVYQYGRREDELAKAGAAMKLRKDIRLYLTPEAYPSLSLMHLLQARNHFETSIDHLLGDVQDTLPQVPEEEEQPEGGIFRTLRRASSRLFLGKRVGRPSSWRKSMAPQPDPLVQSAIAELEQYLVLIEAEIAQRTADCMQASV